MAIRKECGECSRGFERTTMYRTYIRKQDWTGKKKWIPIGWHCPDCKSVEVD